MAKKFLSFFLASSILFGVSYAASISAGAASQVTRQAEVRSPSKVKGFFWKASKDQREIFLLGSIHVGDESLYPLTGGIMAAFSASDVIGVEVNVNDTNFIEKIKRIVASNAKYPGLDHIGNHLSPKLFWELNRIYRSQGLDPVLFQKYLPWFHLIRIGHSHVQALGLSESWGVDKYFLGKVGVHQKFEELERFEDHAYLLTNTMNSKIQLANELNNIEVSREKISMAFEAWKSGDIAAMEKINFENGSEADPEFFRLMEEVLIKRNLVMTSKIEELLSRKSKAFVIVGVAHFLGERGILKLLEDRGVQVVALMEKTER